MNGKIIKDSKNNYSKEIRQLIFKVRRRIETSFSQLTEQLNLNKVKSKSILGFVTRTSIKVLAHNISFLINKYIYLLIRVRYFYYYIIFLNLLVLLWGVDMCTTSTNTISSTIIKPQVQYIEILPNKNCGQPVFFSSQVTHNYVEIA